MDTKTLLRSFLDRLLTMGQELPVYLTTLTQIVQPGLSDEKRLTVLGSMFRELPDLLERISSDEVMSIAQNPPPDAVALRLLLDLYQVHIVLQGISNMQLFQLSTYMLPQSTPQHQLVHIRQLKERFVVWNEAFLNQLHTHIASIPMNFEREALLGTSSHPCVLMKGQQSMPVYPCSSSTWSYSSCGAKYRPSLPSKYGSRHYLTAISYYSSTYYVSNRKCWLISRLV